MEIFQGIGCFTQLDTRQPTIVKRDMILRIYF